MSSVVSSVASSSPFPYTTLFRSQLIQGALGALMIDWGERGGFDPERRAADLAALVADALEIRSDEDRKSTRLNSSHLVISYAVFCLKKKNYRIRMCSTQYTLKYT